jgi:four helix bundle protein
MGREIHDLAVYHLGHEVALRVYRVSASLPDGERFGLQAQLRRAAVSVPVNIVEGSARRHTRDWVRFLEIAMASAAETGYLLRLASELGFIEGTDVADCRNLVHQLERALQRMITVLLSQRS